METIKCHECGCVMSAMSEACPMCGTSMVALNPNNDSFSDIPLFSVNEYQDYDVSLEEAVIMAAGQVKNNPLCVVYINSADEEKAVAADSYMDELCIGSFIITNRPYHFDKPILTKQDCKDVAANIQQSLNEAGVSDLRPVVFTKQSILGVLFDMFKDYSDSVQVELFLGSDASEIAEAVQTFNRNLPTGMGKLELDVEAKKLTGEIKSIPVKGGMFEKRKIKKLNEQGIQSLNDFIVSLYPYLEESL